jgi:glycosyltransferase involved in cell wall biosynthesis
VDTTAPIRVLMLTSAWPQPGQPQTTHFVKRQAEFLQAAGVDVDVLAFRGRRRLRNYVGAWWAAQRRLSTQRYDIIHAQFGHSGLLAFPSRLPLVVTLRGSDILGIVGPGGRRLRIGRLLQAATRFVCRRAAAVIVVSDHMKAYLPRGVDATVLPSGLDFELFRPIRRDDARRRLGLAENATYVLFAGDPAQPRKRYHIAARAVELAAREHPVELLVAWGVPHREMPYYMSAADAMVFTSMQEGSPNVVKEALACDLPVVSVPIGDVDERLRGIEGCEVTADDRAEAVAAALVRVLRRGRRIAGRETVLGLDERACTRRLIGIYRSLLPAGAAVGRVASPLNSVVRPPQNRGNCDADVTERSRQTDGAQRVGVGPRGISS